MTDFHLWRGRLAHALLERMRGRGAHATKGNDMSRTLVLVCTLALMTVGCWDKEIREARREGNPLTQPQRSCAPALAVTV